MFSIKKFCFSTFICTFDHKYIYGVMCMLECWSNEQSYIEFWIVYTVSIVPVFKKGDKHLAVNYRPVSLTSITCKLMEHIMHSQVMDHLDEHSILCDIQHDFRSKRSCETQLIITIEEIARKLVTGEQVDIILLDVSKAFDKVPHRRLLHRLWYYGIRNNTCLWIQDFLSHRTQEVQLEGRKSTTADVLSGMPRGTVLGPLLFLLFINDLPESTESNARLFTDDCLLFRPIRNNRDRQILQNDLNSLKEWENRWQMVFHPEKCVVIRVITKLPNSGQSKKGKVKTHKYINRQNQSTTGKLWKP